jgi:predicted nicotinamide N-methyase
MGARSPCVTAVVADKLQGHGLEFGQALTNVFGIGLPPPFRAFARGGGQALARYLLDHPELVAGKTALYFASGSGLVVMATYVAVKVEANGVVLTPRLQNPIGSEEGGGVMLTGDVF